MAQVLIVDDEVETVCLLARIINLLGHESLEATGFSSAKPFLELDMPDVILLDLMMPEVDGFQTMERIRAMPQGREVPIVVITASPEPDLDKKVKEAGGDALFHKPISMGVLSDAIKKHISQPSKNSVSA